MTDEDSAHIPFVDRSSRYLWSRRMNVRNPLGRVSGQGDSWFSSGVLGMGELSIPFILCMFSGTSSRISNPRI